MPKPEPMHTEDHVTLHVAGINRSVKRLRYLGEVWVPLSVVEEMLQPEQDEETTEEDTDGA